MKIKTFASIRYPGEFYFFISGSDEEFPECFEWAGRLSYHTLQAVCIRGFDAACAFADWLVDERGCEVETTAIMRLQQSISADCPDKTQKTMSS